MEELVVLEKQLYEDKILQYYEEKPYKKSWMQEELDKVAQEILIGKAKTAKKSRREYNLLKNYDVISVEGKNLVIRKMKDTDECITYVTPFEEIYSKLRQFHTETGHGSRDKMIHHISHRFQIPRPCIELFLESCLECQKKKGKQKSKIVVKPLTTKGFMTRGQVDLIDFQSVPDGDFKFILNYQDHATKFICLRPLVSKKAEEVANVLMNIFLSFGAPSILQSDNGREFCNAVIEKMKILWPNLHIVHGRPRHPQSQGSVERSNQDVENMLRAWMADNKSSNWARGCMYVQWQKNTSLHRVIGRTPYKAVFGINPVLGLNTSTVPEHVLSRIETEEELEEALMEMKNTLLDTNTTANNSNACVSIENDVHNDTGNGLLGNLDIDTANNSNEENVEASTSVLFHKCLGCDIYIQGGEEQGEEGSQELNSLCTFCVSQKNIENNRDECFKGQKQQAQKMLTQTKKLLLDLSIGDCVLLNIDKVDRGPADPPNLLCAITDFKNGVYQLGTKDGVIKSWFNREDLQSATSNFVMIKDVNDKPISVREAVAASSLFGGQGFLKCSCHPSKTQCRNNRCLCFRKKVLCNSRCHKSGTCINK